MKNRDLLIIQTILLNLDSLVGTKPYIGILKFFGYIFSPEKIIITKYFLNGNLFHFYSELNAKMTKYVLL